MADRGTVRTRTVFGAVLVVGLALLVAAAAMVFLLRRSLTQSVRSSAHSDARQTANRIADGTDPEALTVSRDDDEFIQILDTDGNVLAGTSTAGTATPVAELEPGDSTTVDTTFDDDPFLVAAAEATSTDGPLLVLYGRTLENVVESTETVTILLLIGLPILLILVGAITWRVTGRALAPVESIRSEVESITSEALHKRVPVPDSTDEIARLAATMNKMLDRLEQAQANERRFVSDASHELRSPVATIRQHLEVAVAHPESTSIDQLVADVLAEDLRLERLVEDLLLLARVGESPTAPTSVVDLDDVVFEETERLRPISTKTLDTSGVSAGRVRGNRQQLGRLVTNLLENAIRYSRDVVSVRLSEMEEEVLLLVDDDGPGIPVDHRQRILERFVRLDEARDRDSGGTGLGLAIVAQVATLHQGTVEITSSPTGGARFEIRLPRAG
jgi:signal transduction histidine kinase